MTITLAVDTAAEFGSIAIADEEGVREEVVVHAPQGFSYVLFSEIEGLLKRQGLALSDIALFAGASGPGSFTGVRVGLAAIKGLAEVMGKQVVAVSNLEALAEFGKSDRRVTVIDARRGEIYAAVYDASGRQIVPELVVSLEKFKSLVPDDATEWISLGVEPLAGAIARIAIRRAGEGLAKDPAAIEANYVRRSDAELLWKEG
jgi:tRNA threonylcarbamoyladenosine biosynthesis protein TsaB